MDDHITPARDRESYTTEDLNYFASTLARISAVAQRKRILGHADPALEAGCIVLQRRLALMRQEVRLA